MRITAVSRRAPQRLVEGYLPPEAITEAAALGQAKAISTPFLRVHMGSALSQGDDVINGPEARALGPTGAGVAVGIISDSIDATPGGGISDSVASGDLPSDTVDLSNPPPASGTDEGRAMAEIVYDEAPGVSRIRFVTANPGPVAKAQGIDALVAAGVKVIADDTSYIAEPFFQDDVIAQAVDRAKAAGVAVFVSAGNDARNAWQGPFTPAPNGMEDFDPSAAVDTMQSVGPVARARRAGRRVAVGRAVGTRRNRLCARRLRHHRGHARPRQELGREEHPDRASRRGRARHRGQRRDDVRDRDPSHRGHGQPRLEVHGADQRGADVDRASRRRAERSARTPRLRVARSPSRPPTTALRPRRRPSARVGRSRTSSMRTARHWLRQPCARSRSWPRPTA